MKVRFFPFKVQKEGNSLSEYEDGYAPKRSGIYLGDGLAFALGDGAAASPFAGMWCNALVRAFARNPFLSDKSLRKCTELLGSVHHQRLEPRQIPWFVEARAKLGAFSTMLGIRFYRVPKGRCRYAALAVGDTCFFQVRDGEVVTRFPLCHPSKFGLRPDLVGSRTEWNSRIWSRVRRQKGNVRLGDSFLMMSDALACWFLEKLEDGAWDRLEEVIESGKHSRQRFLDLVACLREGGEIRNDDTTLLAIKVLADA
jgi:F0F1-type ATP synthase membrane subunit c/vacuolar-type H+-ATPase subunit K